MTVTRHSHRRLMIATGFSTLLLAALMAVVGAWISFSPCSDGSCFEQATEISVAIMRPPAPVEPQPPEPAIEDIPIPTPRIASGPQPEPDNQSEPPVEAEVPVDLLDDKELRTDWYAIGETTVADSIHERFVQEEIREYMWRRTGSVMFEDTGEFDFREPETIIAAREFRVPVGVLGIGVTIGGCFIGIPIAGIPVEERGVGPNVIYCKDIYD